MDDNRSEISPLTIWAWTWAAAALLGGIGEYAAILAARILVHRYTLLNPHGLWLMPAAIACFSAPIVMLAALLSARAPTPTKVSRAVFLCLLVASFSTLLVLSEQLHVLALAALACGIAFRGAQIAKSRPAVAVALSKRIAIAGAVVAVGGGVLVQYARDQRPPSAAVAPTPDSPNVILLVLDTVRAWSLSLYGYERPTTPFLTELAARGMRFDRALSTAPWTLPSHASMFTGRYPHELSTSWGVPLDKTYPTLAEQLSSAGYATAGFAANLRYVSYEFGLSRGFQYYRDYDISFSEMLRSSSLTRRAVMWAARRMNAEPGLGRQQAARINDRIGDWLSRRPADRPFFLFANYYDAHAPYAPPAPYDTAFLGRRPARRDPSDPITSTQDLVELHAAYDASIMYLDAQLRRLFAELERQKALDNTVVIVTSDHGEEFFEHGLMDHGASLYMASVHVPLLVIWPGHVPSGNATGPVTLRDLPSTVLDLAGVPRGAIPGRSLAWNWTPPRDSAQPASPILSELQHHVRLPIGTPVVFGDMKALLLDSLRYIRRGDGFGEMFNALTDPHETRQLSQLPPFLDQKRRLADSVSRIPDFRTP